MDKFTGMEYLQIDAANHYGLDKESWSDRLDWANSHVNAEFVRDKADKPLLFEQARTALYNANNGIPSGWPIALDATAQGLQVMACLSGCYTTASNVNLVDTGNREDIYEKIAVKMNEILPSDRQVTRKLIKKPIMTNFYGSKAQPKELFGEDTPELNTFYYVLEQELPGAMAIMETIQSCWDSNATSYTWKLPDGHVIDYKVMDTVVKKIEIDELDHISFKHTCKVNQPIERGLSLAANVNNCVTH